MFHRLSKHLEFRQKYSAARRIFSSRCLDIPMKHCFSYLIYYLKNLLEEIEATKLYSVMADEVTSHNKEQLALCARFIDKSNDGRTLLPSFICLE